MAARSIQVTLRNELSVPLTHLEDSLNDGIWTEPLRPPRVIAPGATKWWQSENADFSIGTGTEGRARYRIGSEAELDIHWNNPFIGVNFYEQGISGPYGLYFSGGKGNNAEAVYTVMSDARVTVPRFLPSTHGFAFSNHWPSMHITSIALPDPFGDILVGDASWACAAACPSRHATTSRLVNEHR